MHTALQAGQDIVRAEEGFGLQDDVLLDDRGIVGDEVEFEESGAEIAFLRKEGCFVEPERRIQRVDVYVREHSLDDDVSAIEADDRTCTGYVKACEARACRSERSASWNDHAGIDRRFNRWFDRRHFGLTGRVAGQRIVQVVEDAFTLLCVTLAAVVLGALAAGRDGSAALAAFLVGVVQFLDIFLHGGQGCRRRGGRIAAVALAFQLFIQLFQNLTGHQTGILGAALAGDLGPGIRAAEIGCTAIRAEHTGIFPGNQDHGGVAVLVDRHDGQSAADADRGCGCRDDRFGLLGNATADNAQSAPSDGQRHVA